MKATLAAIVLAALALHSAAWQFDFSDDPTCLFTHDGQDGTGNKACTDIEADDDSDHVQLEDLGGCIVTFYEQTGCPVDGGDGELDVFDEGWSQIGLIQALHLLTVL